VRAFCGADALGLQGITVSSRWNFGTPRQQGWSAHYGSRGGGDFLGGVGYFGDMTHAGNGHSCSGGFSDSECQKIRDSLTNLRSHPDEMCRSLGVRSTRRFINGLFAMKGTFLNPVNWAGRFQGDSTFLSRIAFRTGELGATITHEEAHHQGVYNQDLAELAAQTCKGPI
jgi:hypothetical protein